MWYHFTYGGERLMKQENIGIFLIETLAYLLTVFLNILVYFILIRHTLAFWFTKPFTTFLSGTLHSIFFFIYPLISFFMPFLSQKIKRGGETTLYKSVKVITIIFITVISMNYLAIIESKIANQETYVTNPEYIMQPSIPVYPRDKDRGTDFKWLKASLLLLSIGQISLDLFE